MLLLLLDGCCAVEVQRILDIKKKKKEGGASIVVVFCGARFFFRVACGRLFSSFRCRSMEKEKEKTRSGGKSRPNTQESSPKWVKIGAVSSHGTEKFVHSMSTVGVGQITRKNFLQRDNSHLKSHSS